MLILFSYVTSLWFSSGFASGLRTGYSSIIFHLLIWIFFPLALHLHLLLPELPARHPQTAVVGLTPLYALTVLATLLDAFLLLGRFQSIYVWTTLAAVRPPLGLLLLRLFLPIHPASKVANR